MVSGVAAVAALGAGGAAAMAFARGGGFAASIQRLEAAAEASQVASTLPKFCPLRPPPVFSLYTVLKFRIWRK